MYLSRSAENHIQRYLQNFSVVGLTGPRQSGKSTMLQQLLPEYQYVNFDDLKNIDFFENDPEGFIATYANRVIFDEVQFVPKLFHYIKITIDKDRLNYGKFVLTGSNQFAYLKNTTESLAGRMGLMSLLPLEYQEMPKALLESSIYQGAYPELVLRNYRESELWYSAYLDTYLNKDLRTLSNIGDMRDFRRFLNLLAAQTSKILDMNYYANNIGVSAPTIKRWVSILEASYIIFLLPPYYNNLGKRIIKRPKVYFYDTGLVSYLTGIKTFEHYDKGPMAGALFENYIISEIKKQQLHRSTNNELYFIRTADQAEVDLIIDNKQKQTFIEIKKTASFSLKLISTLKRFKQENSDYYLIYQGENLPKRSEISIINYNDYLKSDITLL